MRYYSHRHRVGRVARPVSAEGCGEGTPWGCGRLVAYPAFRILENARPGDHKYGPHALFHPECFEEVKADPHIEVIPLDLESALKGTR